MNRLNIEERIMLGQATNEVARRVGDMKDLRDPDRQIKFIKDSIFLYKLLKKVRARLEKWTT